MAGADGSHPVSPAMTSFRSDKRARSLVAEIVDALVAPAGGGVPRILELLSPEASKLAHDVSLIRKLRALAPRIVGGMLVELHASHDGVITAIVRTTDDSIVLVMCAVHAAEDALVGLGIRPLPPDARPWSDQDGPIGVVVASEVYGEIRIELQGLQTVERHEPVRATSVFRVGSIAKLVTATGVLLLAHDGILSLDDPLSMHLPADLATPQSREGSSVRDVLRHRGGLPSNHADIPLGDVSDATRLRHACALARPSVFRYSNLGYELLGRLITQCTGRPAEDWLTENVLSPLELGRSGFRDEPNCAEGYRLEFGFLYREQPLKIAPTAGGLFMTGEDLVSLGAWIAGVREQGETSVLTHVARVLLESDLGMLTCDSERSIFSFGGTMPGFRSGLAVLPGTGAAAVVANTADFDAVHAARGVLRERIKGGAGTPWR